MKRLLYLVAVALLLPAGTLTSQNTGNSGNNTRDDRIYDEKTVTRISGEVTAIEQIMQSNGSSGGIHITVRAGSANYTVHLGPKWFLDKQTVQIKTGDRIQVLGSKVWIDSKQAIIAKEVVKDKNTLILRDQRGKPLWAGKSSN